MAAAIRYYFAVTILVALFRFHANRALPNYIPYLRSSNGDREALIEDYFCLGFSYWEVLSFLLVYHDTRGQICGQRFCKGHICTLLTIFYPHQRSSLNATLPPKSKAVKAAYLLTCERLSFALQR